MNQELESNQLSYSFCTYSNVTERRGSTKWKPSAEIFAEQLAANSTQSLHKLEWEAEIKIQKMEGKGTKNKHHKEKPRVSKLTTSSIN